MLYTNRDQLATDLLYLVKEDPQLLVEKSVEKLSDVGCFVIE